MKVKIASIQKNRYEDGPGIRLTVFFQGCNVKCKGCHNSEIQDIRTGREYEVKKLCDEIMSYNLPVKKITISGGEPLMQKEALEEFINEMHEKDFEIALYTSYDFKDVSRNILKKLKYLKVGKYMHELRIQGKFFGSSNQKFYSLKNGEIVNEN
ncbi:4Fe-4S single cluster domain-containing protein [Leptotrichia buccalis]|jgi:anaerobic ribonucleoside-triphosphate reductase-activating protein|uniref:Anaerobic ribonucleoside-triphosphate reductase-activating protein n=1 Tax=Leptotrichia buccalis (strain ATCC 14201 / DSM 1135 / JCM 12969 / NCTC 10249 / C-1013-b) TaxID=523794 RepID=C7NA12_LEPBD|nr:4Fe-4S single cluster domain-containing protein [Leptotrichia buccalis]ACV38993.1 anaerobic ribonucleoside-triphosphate reductase activating protein [Leptotrichia buccalis C-1013-b]